MLYDGGEFGTATAPGSPEEEDFLGLPGLLEPEQVAHLLRKRQADQLKTRSRATGDRGGAPGGTAVFPGPGSVVPGPASRWRVRFGGPGPGPAGPGPGAAGPGPNAPADAAPPVSREALAALRKELNGLVAAWNHRTGQPHGVIHADLRRACGGPPLPQATADQIRARIDMIRTWAAARR